MKIQLLVSVLFCVTEVYSYQSSFIRNCLDAHNAVRAHHGVPALKWSAEIAVNAQKWANHLAAIDQLQHDSTTTDGENLFYMYGGDPEQACDRAVKNWYLEVKNYDFRSPHLDDSTNHFSQLVWSNSKELGIGTAQSKSGNFFLVARYNPPGNIDGQFNDNVKEVQEQASHESSQENKDNNNSGDFTPAQDESSPSQNSNEPNVIYFKEINVDPSSTALENTAEPNPSPPQQADVQYGPRGGPAAESGREPETTYTSSIPETQEIEATQPSYAVVNSMKQELSPSQEEPSSSQEAFNERPNYKQAAEMNEKLTPSEPDGTFAHSAPLYQGSDHMQSRPFYPESEIGDMKTRPTETKKRPEAWQSSEAKEEKEPALEKFAQKPMHDELPTKIHEPPAGLTYIPPVMPKTPPKKPAPAPLKLPPKLALITPKRGKDFRVTIRFTKMNYSSQMEVPGSLPFEEAKRNITSAIINLFDEDDQFQEVQLISLRNGSVIATLGLLFAKDAPSHLDPLTRALLAGKIGDMPVAPKYESAVALPAGYLRPNRPVQEQGPGVCAQPCSRPNGCYSTGCTAACCAFHPHKYHPPAQVSPSVLPTCPGTCDDGCFPDCDDDCCTDMMQAPYTAGAVAPVAAPPSITCPGSCHFSCYPQCSPQCCATQYVPNPCHASCPAYCAPSCDNTCCTARKSSVNSLSRKYSQYRSAQRALARQLYLKKARQLYLKKRLGLQSFRHLKPARLARPVRPRQRSYYGRRARVRPESLGLDEYDHSITEWAKKGDVTKHANEPENESGDEVD